MVQNLIIVSEQVAILFILIALGFVCGRTKLITDSSAKVLTDLVLYFATPCIMIKSFQEVRYDPDMVINLAVTALCAALIITVSMVIVRFIFRSKDLKNGTINGNNHLSHWGIKQEYLLFLFFLFHSFTRGSALCYDL